jgi:hypothetical protein
MQVSSTAVQQHRTPTQRHYVFQLQSLHWPLMRLCSQMLGPPQSLHLLLMRLCSQMPAPPQSLHPPEAVLAPAPLTVMLDSRC